ncbi:MAG: caspase family protein [Actinomycetota bacterium]|nr:caspase family protein [Actinomycetota bacterium]
MRRLIAAGIGALLVSMGGVAASNMASAAPSPTAEKWALVIGITEYDAPTRNTVGGANDARVVQKALLANGWAADRIKMLVDADATAANIVAGMDWLVQNSTPTSFSVFHFSGHTRQADDGHSDGDNEQFHEFLWARNNQFVSDREVGARMRALRGHAWINMSNCEAAGFEDGFAGPTKLFTAASREDEKGYERYETGKSILTGLMVEEALLGGAGDADRNGKVSIQEAFAYAAAAAPGLSAAGEYGPQHPVMMGGDDGGQWYLSAPAPPKPSLVPSGLLPPGLVPPGLIPPGLVPPGLLPEATRSQSAR